MFDNPDKKKSCLSPGEIPEPQPMPEVRQKKVILCVCWDMKGIIYYELESHQTVTAERYRKTTTMCSRRPPAETADWWQKKTKGSVAA